MVRDVKAAKTTLDPSIRITVCDTAEGAQALVADRIAATLVSGGVTGHGAVLGLATGRTPRGVYAELVRRYERRELSFGEAWAFNLDEYWPLPPEHPASFTAAMRRDLVDRVDLDPEHWWIPDGGCPEDRLAEHAREFEARVVATGGLDLQLLGIGRNGHVAFNEPGSPADGRTRKVELQAETLEDAAAAFGGVEWVPRSAITMGLGTIARARRLLLVALGSHKAGIVGRALAGSATPDVPASLLRGHPGLEVILDRAAAAELPAQEGALPA